jgi:hypothetical protein
MPTFRLGEGKEITNLRDPTLLLRMSGHRQCRNAAEERDELAPLHICSQAQETTLYRLKRVL